MHQSSVFNTLRRMLVIKLGKNRIRLDTCRPILHFQIRKQFTARQRLLITCEATRRRAAAVATLVAVGATKQPTPRRRVQWKHPFLLGHDEPGEYPTLVRELANDDLQTFCNFLRMTPEAFQDIHQHIEPLIQRSDTNFHRAISSGERLAVTLRHMATGTLYPCS